MYKNRQQGFSGAEYVIVLLVLVSLIVGLGVLPGGGVVEAKSNIDISTLRLKNPGCAILDPVNSQPFDMTGVLQVPAGSLIRRECFPSPQQIQIEQQKAKTPARSEGAL